MRRAGGAEDLLPEGSQPPMPMNSRKGGYADASFGQLALDPGDMADERVSQYAGKVGQRSTH